MLKLDNGVSVDVQSNTDGHIVTTHQTIPDSLLKDLADKRLASHNVREREMMHVASIPAALVDKWYRDGYDVFQEPIKKTVAKLKNENLEYFLATEKAI
jgi:hypothetical protein